MTVRPKDSDIRRFNKYGFDKYVILGDDIVIFDENIAKVYLRLLKYLGIGISIEKCFISPNVCEFTKKFILRDKIIYPFSLSILCKNFDSFLPNMGVGKGFETYTETLLTLSK